MDLIQDAYQAGYDTFVTYENAVMGNMPLPENPYDRGEQAELHNSWENGAADAACDDQWAGTGQDD